MASPLLRSSAAILRRSNPRAWTFPRRPGQCSVEGSRFLTAGAGVVVEPKDKLVVYVTWRREQGQPISHMWIVCDSDDIAARNKNYACCMARIEMEEELEKVAVNLRLRALEEKLDILEEHERRFQRSERFPKKLACVLIPATIGLYVFGPGKKAKEQSNM